MNMLFWALALTFAAYSLSVWLRKRLDTPLLPPILVSSLLVMGILLLFRIPVNEYSSSIEPLSRLMLPCTVCLAVPLYRQISLLQKHLAAILVGILTGVLTAFASVVLTVRLFGLDTIMLATMLPKSITTAFGMDLAAEYGGIPSLAAALIILTGIFGNLVAGPVCKIFGVRSPVAIGLGIGASAHALGSAKALELGQTEGGMAGLAMVLSGLFTIGLMPLCMRLFA